MSEYQIIINSKLTDLNPVVAGQCSVGPNHVQNLHMINYILIHYVRIGNGTYYIDNQAYPIGEGTCYMTLPGQQARFVSSEKTPLQLEWVGFTGQLSHDFSTLPPVFSVPDEPFPHLKTILTDTPLAMGIGLSGDLFHLYYTLLGDKTSKRDYAAYISEYIRAHYMEKISVEGFAQQFGIDRRHMSAKFKEKTGYSVQGFLTKTRIDEAMSYLAQGYSGKEVAKLCGFSDAHNFYKAFKKRQGLRPAEWKEKQVMLTKKYHDDKK